MRKTRPRRKDIGTPIARMESSHQKDGKQPFIKDGQIMIGYIHHLLALMKIKPPSKNGASLKTNSLQI